MNKSIVKTRNQLERITYKINQLKNKYAGENYLQEYPPTGAINLSQQKKTNKQKMRNSDKNRVQFCLQQENDGMLRDRSATSIKNLHKNKSSSSKKQLKYIQKDRDDFYMADSIHRNRKSVPVVPAVLKIDQPLKNVENIDEFVTSKALKSFQSQIYTILDKTIASKIRIQIDQSQQNEKKMQERLRLFINEAIESKIFEGLKYDTNKHEEHDRRLTKLEQQVTECVSSIEGISQQLQVEGQNLQTESLEQPKQLPLIDQQQIMEIINLRHQKLRQQLNMNNQKITSQIQNIIKQIKLGEGKNLNQEDKARIIQQSQSRFHEQITKIVIENKQEMQKLGAKFSEQYRLIIEENMKMIQEYRLGIEKDRLASQDHRQAISQQLKDIQFQIQKIALEGQKHQKKAMKYIEQLEHKIPQLSANRNSRSEQKLSQLEERHEEISTKISQIMAQMSSQTNQADEARQQIQKLHQLLSEYQSKIQSLFSHPQSNKIPLQNQSSSNIQAKVQQKLNSFEDDINETLKLLYDDIQKKVAQMMEGSQSQEHNMIQNLREELSETVGTQIDKLSNIVERTVEEIQVKMEKLDNNFGYVYDRMSKIEYDNARYKDELANVHGECKNMKEIKIKRDEESEREGDNSLLNILGDLSNGKQINTLGILQ